jgi:tryptophan synthase alpha chain
VTSTSRIDRTFARLRDERRPGLITYTTAGDPDLARSGEILYALDRAGADILEVGVPFSEPLADGPVIQRAVERALAHGGSLPAVLDMVARVRAGLVAPIVLFTYANPIFRLGVSAFAARAAEAGVDGVLVVDLPIEEAGQTQMALHAVGIQSIFLLSPTTSVTRIRQAAALGRGFLYAISRLGVTGAHESLADGVPEMMARIRAETPLPIALGFGLSTPAQVREAGRWADAAVVGSALVRVIGEGGAAVDAPKRAGAFVRWLRGTGPAPAGSAAV